MLDEMAEEDLVDWRRAAQQHFERARLRRCLARASIDQGFCAQEQERLSQWEKYNKVGGWGGICYAARHNVTGEEACLKQVTRSNEEIDDGDVRWIALMRTVSNEGIVGILDIYALSESRLWLRCEYSRHSDQDLKEYMRNVHQYRPPAATVRRFGHQLLRAVGHLHSLKILHRDIKPTHIIVDGARRAIKLCGFRFARRVRAPRDERPHSHCVVTLWYRAPELLLGGEHGDYGPGVDLWSCGAVLAEMSSGQPLRASHGLDPRTFGSSRAFLCLAPPRASPASPINTNPKVRGSNCACAVPGDSEIDQLFKTFRLLGTPTEATWPGVRAYVDFCGEFPRWPPTPLHTVLTRGLSDSGLDLVGKLLTCAPEKRLDAAGALSHPYFAEASGEA